jgi:hypothetical protein
MAEKLISIWVFLLLLNPVKPDVATPLLDEFSGGFSAAANNLTLEGVAEVENNGVLQLTDYNSTMVLGHAFYSYPIQFKNSSGEVMSFSTSFAFVIIQVTTSHFGNTTLALSTLLLLFILHLSNTDLGIIDTPPTHSRSLFDPTVFLIMQASSHLEHLNHESKKRTTSPIENCASTKEMREK